MQNRRKLTLTHLTREGDFKKKTRNEIILGWAFTDKKTRASTLRVYQSKTVPKIMEFPLEVPVHTSCAATPTYTRADLLSSRPLLLSVSLLLKAAHHLLHQSSIWTLPSPLHQLSTHIWVKACVWQNFEVIGSSRTCQEHLWKWLSECPALEQEEYLPYKIENTQILESKSRCQRAKKNKILFTTIGVLFFRNWIWNVT